MAPPAPKPSEVVLLVDDDPAPRDLAAKFLRDRGFAVIVAGDGPSALKIAKGQPGRIHLLLTDVIMPGMNGPELAEALRKARPSLRIAYMSAYDDDLLAQEGVALGDAILISKPFSSEELYSWVRVALDRPSTVRKLPDRR